jgi:hypothetical protein
MEEGRERKERGGEKIGEEKRGKKKRGEKKRGEERNRRNSQIPSSKIIVFYDCCNKVPHM